MGRCHAVFMVMYVTNKNLLHCVYHDTWQFYLMFIFITVQIQKKYNENTNYTLSCTQKKITSISYLKAYSVIIPLGNSRLYSGLNKHLPKKTIYYNII